jgi:starch phosphorylase
MSSLILLDTWLTQNSEHDREITHRLYGGDKTTSHRAGNPARRRWRPRPRGKLGLKPTVWHVNEGHAAFLILERIRSLVSGGLPYAAAHRGGRFQRRCSPPIRRCRPATIISPKR